MSVNPQKLKSKNKRLKATLISKKPRFGGVFLCLDFAAMTKSHHEGGTASPHLCKLP